MNDAGYKPPATGAEAGEEERIVLATVQRLLNTVASHDMDEMSKILLPEGHAVQSRDHQIAHTELANFAEKIPAGPARLEERFYNPLVRVDDDIAMVWAHYDFLVGGKVHHWGTNIVSFLKQDGRWRVSGIADNGRTGPRPEDWEKT
jgi:hypothetical protein